MKKPESFDDLISEISKLQAKLKKIEDSFGKDIKVGTNHYHLAPNHTLTQIGNIVMVVPEKKEFG